MDNGGAALAILVEGVTLRKWGKKGSPRETKLSLSADHTFIQWDSKRKDPEDARVAITEIKNVVFGRQETQTFLRRPEPHVENLSMSVIYVHQGEHRTLDIACDNKQTFEAVRAALSFLLGLETKGQSSDEKFVKREKKDVKTKYDLKGTLGEGSFAVVKKGVNKITGEEFAIKVIDKKSLGSDSSSESDMENEIDILCKINHRNIVQLFEIYETPSYLYLVMELVTGGELFDSVVEKGFYSEKDAAEVMRDVVLAIQYLHSKNVVHRDLKPENLLYSTNDEATRIIKVADFGLAKVFDTSGTPDMTMVTTCGTPGYVAPEVLKGGGYGKAVDLWSVGVILYILLCGFPPFYNENTSMLFEQIMEGDFDFPSPYWDDISDSAKSLVKGLLTVDAKKRLTCEECLEHPWLKGLTANAAPIKDLADNIKKFNAKKKLRQGIKAIMAANRIRRLSQPTIDPAMLGQ
mmetsp:Transcript_4013/g.7750  ORF Transcript_4013/g.7750 Transcript_4013/m.7750 type:complete len:463 (-) Transcript_4013:266-1654(-)